MHGISQHRQVDPRCCGQDGLTLVHPFQYRRPETVAEARSLFESADDARYLAGGHTLIPTMKMRLDAPTDLIDIGRLESLRGIRHTDNSIVISAGERHGSVARSQTVRTTIPALADLAGMIGDFQVRNRGTLGGSIANADPAADYPAAIVALGATVRTDQREISGDDYFVDLFQTELEFGEIVTGVSFPVPRRAAYMKFPNPASRYALVGVFVAETKFGVRVAVTGAGACVFRVPEMEAALAADFRSESVENIFIPDEGLNSDIHAPADYRAHLVTIMAKRAVSKALE